MWFNRKLYVNIQKRQLLQKKTKNYKLIKNCKSRHYIESCRKQKYKANETSFEKSFKVYRGVSTKKH